MSHYARDLSDRSLWCYWCYKKPDWIFQCKTVELYFGGCNACLEKRPTFMQRDNRYPVTPQSIILMVVVK